jgi:adenosylhomocysteinase
MEKAGKLKFPVIAVNDNKTKHLFDNYYGTGQSTLDGIIRASNIMIAGKIVVVAGYGSCGKGVAQKARGLGANVIVTEVNPIESLRARFDGFRVMMMEDACKEGDIFITVTGDINVITMNHIQYMKDGAILANSGHFDCEIDTKNMKKEAKKIENIRPYFDKYYFSLDYQRPNYVYLCGDGRLVNLACAEGHPSIVMSTSFCGQVLALEYGLEVQESIKSDDLCEYCFGNHVHTLPEYLDQEIAKLQLESLGIEIDELTEEQIKYLNSWEAGT